MVYPAFGSAAVVALKALLGVSSDDLVPKKSKGFLFYTRILPNLTAFPISSIHLPIQSSIQPSAPLGFGWTADFDRPLHPPNCCNSTAMAQRFVRVQSTTGTIHYGLLKIDHQVQLLDAPPWKDGQLTAVELMPGDYHLLAPCAPSKIIGVGKNYANHAAEMGTPVPTEPLLFLKPPTTVIAAGSEIRYPAQSTRVDYEGELAVVIGARAEGCTPEQAESKIWGYTIANDVTARDLQQRDAQWTRAKGFDSFCPIGPWIVRDLNPGARLQTLLNGQVVQSAPIGDMVFPPDVLVAYISQVMTLLPGDVILTGTPAGVGPMQSGDRVRVEIEGIGYLENAVVERAGLDPTG
jgi:2-keto-4-pentenoate hydratase/2-oxohepta-3-ene-1,7-dioic acid hydratase in catechol pathway